MRKNYFFNDCVLLELDCYAKSSKDRAVLKDFVLKN